MRNSILFDMRVFIGAWAIAAAAATAVEPVCKEAPVALRTSEQTRAIDEALPVRVFPVPPDAQVQRHYYGTRGSGIVGEPVYSNTRGAWIVAPGSGRLIADDVVTVAVGGCDVSAYEITVGVYGSEGGGAGYTVNFGIYDGCPSGDPPGQLVPGTGGTVAFDDDGLLHLIAVDLEGSEVTLGSDFWVGVEFNGNSMAGWIAGETAELGFTRDVYDYPHPNYACVARFGGTNLYAGYDVRVYCTGEFDREFPAYYNTNLNAPFSAPGADQWMIDDVYPIVDECVLSSYEVAVVGTGGPFTMNVALWRTPDEAGVIEGTQRTYEGLGDESVERVRFDFPEGLDLSPSGSLFIAWKFDSGDVGPVVSGEPDLGFSDDVYFMPGCG